MSRARTSSRSSTAEKATAEIDPRFFDLILDSLTRLQAFTCSCLGMLPYASLRAAFYLESEERGQIVEAAQTLAYDHRDWLREHGGPALFLAVLTATQVVKLDAMLTANPDFGQSADSREAHLQLIWGLAFVFLPVLLFGLIFLIHTWSEKR